VSRDRIVNAALVMLTLCAISTTALAVRREFAAPPGARPRVVDNWRSVAATGHRLGPADAPLTLVVFSDYQCPFCAVLSERLRELRTRYPGEVAVVYRHYPLSMHSHSRAAAKASECAGAQGRFEPFHDALFASTDSIGVVPWERFAHIARVPDAPRFKACAASEASVPALALDTAAGRELQVTGTPTMLVNERLITGVPPMDTLEAFVRQARRIKL
jgi:protein-disulfide isomerase